MAQNRHGQSQSLRVEYFAQTPTGKRSAMRSPLLRESTQLLESRRAFGPERAHAEPRMERLLRGRIAAEPVEALNQRTSTGPCRALGHDRATDGTPAVRDPAQRLLNAGPAKDVQTRRVYRIC